MIWAAAKYFVYNICSIGSGDYKRSNTVWFYQRGISGKNTVNSKGWKVQTFGRILLELGHSEVEQITLSFHLKTVNAV